MELTSNHNTYSLANLAHIIDTDVNAIEGELKALKSWLYLDVFGADDDELAAEVDIGLMDNVAVHEAKAAAQALEDAHIRCRLDILSEDRSYHRYGNGGLGTRMCVLVAPEDYEKAKKVVL